MNGVKSKLQVDPFTYINAQGEIVPHKTNIAVANKQEYITPVRVGFNGGGQLGGFKRVDANGNRHPRLCKGVRRGKPCGAIALKGVHLCRFCGGRRLQRRIDGTAKIRVNDVEKLRFYGKRLAPKMKALVEELLDAPDSEQVRLNEELAIVRQMAGDAVAIWSAVEELQEDTPEKKKLKDSMKLQAEMCVRTALAEVKGYCSTMAHIDALAKDKFSIHSLHDVVAQITKIVMICFDHDKEGLQRFDDMLTNQLRLPQIGSTGTTITPDADVIEMDEMIPSAPPEEIEQEQYNE